jgi:hypothetical protein
VISNRTHNGFNDHVLCISFQSFNKLYQKNKRHHKMRRVKLYNLQKIVFLTVPHFAVKMDKVLIDQISTLRKNNTNEKFLCSRPTFLSPVQIVQLFALHLATYFVFIHENILSCRKMKEEKKDLILCKKI